MLGVAGLGFGARAQTTPAAEIRTRKKAEEWFRKREWAKGLKAAEPHYAAGDYISVHPPLYSYRCNRTWPKLRNFAARTNFSPFSGSHFGHQRVGHALRNQRLRRNHPVWAAKKSPAAPLLALARWPACGRYVPARVCKTGCHALQRLFYGLDAAGAVGRSSGPTLRGRQNPARQRGQALARRIGRGQWLGPELGASGQAGQRPRTRGRAGPAQGARGAGQP